MKKILSMMLILGIGFLSMPSMSVEAKGKRSGSSHHVSSHSRRITTTKKGVTHTRTVHVKSHRSK